MSIDPSKIKAGDTVRVRYQYENHPPVEWEGVAWSVPGSVTVFTGPLPVRSSSLTILEHTPARPDWADALVIHAKGLGYSNDHLIRDGMGLFNSVGNSRFTVGELREYEVTVVIDADGNAPQPEPEWLDADALNDLPAGTAVVTKYGRSCIYGGVYWYMPKSGRSDNLHRSSEIAPARLLWAPES